MGDENLSVILQSSTPVSKGAVKLLYTENSTWLGRSQVRNSTMTTITCREYISLITEASLWPRMSQHATCRSVPSPNTAGSAVPADKQWRCRKVSRPLSTREQDAAKDARSQSKG